MRGLASAAPLEIEKERRRDGETGRDCEGERYAYVRGKETKEQKREPESTEFFSANRLLN